VSGKPETARSYRATVLDDNAVVSINLKWLAQIAVLISGLVYSYWRIETRIIDLEKNVSESDIQIEELVEKHIVEEQKRFAELEEELQWYQKEVNLNPLSWKKRKKNK
tara:strand:+ start:66 stop:389 length:324 start_codon:yes stop_codon:yes gene_type:complete